MFPFPSRCDTTDINVPIALNNATAIDATLTMTFPGGPTPTATAVQKGTAYLTALNDPHPKYILLATDGLPNCFFEQGFLDATQMVAAAATAGFKSFVVGVGTGPIEDVTLNDMANAGQMQRQGGPPFYYPAQNPMDLENALAAIASQILSCTFELPDAPPDPSNVEVSVNGMVVPRDPTHTDGWDLIGPDASGKYKIVFYGPSCEATRAVGVDVQVVLGCPPVGKPSAR
jgi:hypothetical protein